jgi:hypothetical protein
MPNTALADFIGTHRDELISRCLAKARTRSGPGPAPADSARDRGVPLFLKQLHSELSPGSSKHGDMSQSALEHGRDLRMRGFTIAQVVYDYGDVCQSIGDLAVDTHTQISAEEFRTLNRCLDSAIAGAVTEFTREEKPGAPALADLRHLASAALTAFELLQDGKIGMNGVTAGVLHNNLATLLAYLERTVTKAT